MLRGGNIACPSFSSDILFTPISVFVISLVAKKSKKGFKGLCSLGKTLLVLPSVLTSHSHPCLSVWSSLSPKNQKRGLRAHAPWGKHCSSFLQFWHPFRPICVFVISLVAKKSKKGFKGPCSVGETLLVPPSVLTSYSRPFLSLWSPLSPKQKRF